MKRTKILCSVLAATMLLQVQPVYAAQKPLQEEIHLQKENLQEAADQNGTNQNGADQNSANQNGTDQNGKNQNGANQNGANQDGTNQDSTDQNSTNQNSANQDGMNQDGADQPVPIPSKITGLRTTSQTQTKVKIEWNACENAAYTIYRKQGSGAYHELATAEKPSYTDKKIKEGKNYHYKIVAYNTLNQEGEAATIAFSNAAIVKIASQKYTYAQMKQQMKMLKNKYSDYCEMTEIGSSVKGHSLYDFTIGSPDADSSVLVVGTMHAREYICATVLMQEIEYYLSNYNCMIGGMKPADVLENTQIHYVVMANPDGVEISQKSYARWKSNARGVDLNRNFPTKKFVSGGTKGAEGYSGKKALSEPESQAVAALTVKLKTKQKLQGVINYHAMGRIIYGSCSSKKIAKDTKTMYQIAKRETNYIAAPESSKTKSPGGQYREYVMYLLGIPSITIEVGKTWAPCSYYEYKTEFLKNKNVFLKITKAIS